MIHKLCFSNPGEIDVRLITTLGVNVKEPSEGQSSIGEFGTGLKYAIAGVLRLGGQIRISSGLRQLKFGLQPQTIRGKEFQFIEMTMDSVVSVRCCILGFTTELGKHWEPWMLYRELWANCKDEGGLPVEVHTEWPVGIAGITRISVECPELYQIWMNEPEHFISAEEEPLWTSETLQVFPASSSLICYNGVRMLQVVDGKSGLFTYNLTGRQQLTEDRTLRNPWQAKSEIGQQLLGCRDREVLEKVLLCSSDYFESGLDFDWWSASPSQEFVEISLKNVRGVNPSVLAMLRKHRGEELEKALERALPTTWEEMIAQAPETPKLSSEASSATSLVYELQDVVKKALESEKFWRSCAATLAGQQVPEIEEKEEEIPW